MVQREELENRIDEMLDILTREKIRLRKELSPEEFKIARKSISEAWNELRIAKVKTTKLIREDVPRGELIKEIQSVINKNKDIVKKIAQRTDLPSIPDVPTETFEERAEKREREKQQISRARKGGGNAYWGEVERLKKNGMSEESAKERAKETVKKRVDSYIDLDALLLRNQPIAKEGTLPYRDGNKLKRWEDLKRNIGKKVPVVNEHPPITNGRNGLVTEQDRKFGTAIIKQCARGNRLCADLTLDDDAPVKKGYSIGYEFLHVDKQGDFDGEHYDSIQANLEIDHLALTDFPRDEDELQIAGDSKIVPEHALETGITRDNSGNNTVININRIGYDSLEFVDVNKHRQILDLARKLRETNDTTATDAELFDRARVMIENGETLKQKQENQEKSGNDTMIQGADVSQGMNEEKKKKDEEEEKTSGDALLSLTRENEKLKAELSARDSTEELRAKLKRAEDKVAQYEKNEADRKRAEQKAEVDSLIQKGYKSETFNGENPDFVRGFSEAVKLMSKGAETGEPAGDAAIPGSDAEARWGSDSFNPGVWCAKCNDYHADKPRCR